MGPSLVERALGPAGTLEARGYTERALAQTRRLGELVERLFDVSRVQAGRLELVVAPVDLVSAIRDTVEAFAALPSAPTIRFSAPKGSVVVHADRGRLEQVFANLITNAVEHAAASPAIDVTLRRSGSVAVVKVRDEGPGIPRAELPLLFQPYTRLGHKTSSGLGLGLYLSREIVAAHGGTIEAHSTVGRGTEMVARLPLHEMSARGRELRAGVVR